MYRVLVYISTPHQLNQICSNWQHLIAALWGLLATDKSKEYDYREHTKLYNSARLFTSMAESYKRIHVWEHPTVQNRPRPQCSQSESHCDWRSVRLPVLVSSPVWGSWPDISYCVTVTVLSLGARPLWQEDGSVVCQCQSAGLFQLPVCIIFTFYMFYMVLNVYTIYTRPLSVRARYSRLCLISGSFRYNGSLVTWTVLCLTVAKFKPLLFSVTGNKNR
jgi:hypothetical protein